MPLLPISHFPFLDERDAANPKGIWGWAKRICTALQRFRLFDLMDVPIDDKPYNIMRVTPDGMAWELVPEEMGLSGQDLTGLANRIVRVKPTEDGYFIDKEVLHSLLGVSLVGKAGQFVKVKADETGFEIAP